ncbi:dipeptide/oligopeptide/nickel ABC transporter permease/ATP-binding protein [Microlunatus sp. GCM10028923]|uniref:dipeptide/oligopeptide/nickel ABC transporter permease/ATP-binding protein n=1 Tax=Microlunatus sp. GCM10028923 TaxID=3273400 RepID=UPI00361BCA6B
MTLGLRPTLDAVPGAPRRRGFRGVLGVAAITAVAVLILLAVLGPLLASGPAAAMDVAARLAPPSPAHPFGTDELGRDILARTLSAAGLSIGLALAATALAVGLGLLLGLVPAVLRGRARSWLVGALEVALAFPWLLTAMFFSVIWSGGLAGPVLALGCASAPSFARLTYTLASGAAGRDYVRAARVLGVGRPRIVLRHLLPNIAEPLIVNAAAAAGGMLLAFSVLSFLGIGLQPPYLDWGRLFNEGMNRAYVSPIAALGPGLAIILASICFTVLGEALAAAAGLRTSVGLNSLVRKGSRRTRPDPRALSLSKGQATSADAPVLSVRDLEISFPGAGTTPVTGVSFDVFPGEVVGIVGESGSGKSLTALACAGLSDPRAVVDAVELTFDGRPVPASTASLSRAERRRLGTTLSMIFQDPMTSLNPSLRLGTQLAEVAETHLGEGRAAARRRAVDRLAQVRIDQPELRIRQYPQQLSGGMRQRASIAMSLMGDPKLIIADEPTTALDVTVQRQVLAQLDRARRSTGAAVILISHDIALISGFCDRVLVMYQGRLVEQLPTADLTTRAEHPYTRALLACIPDLETDKSAPLRTIAEELAEPVPDPAEPEPAEPVGRLR